VLNEALVCQDLRDVVARCARCNLYTDQFTGYALALDVVIDDVGGSANEYYE
jgi:hypothetical protein